MGVVGDAVGVAGGLLVGSFEAAELSSQADLLNLSNDSTMRKEEPGINTKKNISASQEWYLN